MRSFCTAVPAFVLAVSFHGFSYAAVYEDLLTYSDIDLRTFMQSLAEGTGETCTDVTGAAFKGADENESGYFVFDCREGTSFILRVDDDGTGKLIECGLAETMSIDCSADWANWPFDAPPDEMEQPHTEGVPALMPDETMRNS